MWLLVDFDLFAEMTRDWIKSFDPKSSRKGGPEAYLRMHKAPLNLLKIFEIFTNPSQDQPKA